jgi:phospholipid transport system substrate-binding protein
MAVSKLFPAAILALGIAASAGAVTTPPASDPASVVKQTSTEIINALDQNEAKLKQDPSIAEDLVKKYLLPNFDFDLTCQLVLGRYWRTATSAQRQEFEQAFLHYLTTTYANGIKGYHGASIEVLPFRGDTSQQYVKVRTQVSTPDHQPIEVDYALTKTPDGWKAFDVIIAGVSYVQTYQNEFQAEVQRTSLDALIKRLQTASPPPSSASAASAGTATP